MTGSPNSDTHGFSRPVAAARRASILLSLAVLLAACSGSRTTADPTAPPATDIDTLRRNSSTSPSGVSPSLADEIRAQGVREARDLERKIGVRLEPVERTSGPTWWAATVADPSRAAGTDQAASLPDAFNGAVGKAARIAQARGVDPRTLRVERASWLRLATGTYVVWAALGDGTKSSDPLPPIDLPPVEMRSDAKPAPAPSGGSIATPAPGAAPGGTPPPQPGIAAADPDAPAWFSIAPTQTAGRVTVGATADSDTEQDAQRLAYRAARNQLGAITGAEPRDLTTFRSQANKLQDGRYRAYAMVSCAGTIRH